MVEDIMVLLLFITLQVAMRQVVKTLTLKPPPHPLLLLPPVLVVCTLALHPLHHHHHHLSTSRVSLHQQLLP